MHNPWIVVHVLSSPSSSVVQNRINIVSGYARSGVRGVLVAQGEKGATEEEPKGKGDHVLEPEAKRLKMALNMKTAAICFLRLVFWFL